MHDAVLERLNHDSAKPITGSEYDTGVAGRHVAGGEHIAAVRDGGAPQEHRRAEDRGHAHHAVALEGEQAHRGEAEAGIADLRLERTVGPADEAGGELAEEDVESEVVERTK